MKNNESKYFYTANLMNQALLALLEVKDLEFITITEITKKAGVNRSTFYLHYDNIYELLEETVENITKSFASCFDDKKPLKIQSKTEAFWITEEYLVPYLNFCKEHKRVLKLAHKHPQVFGNKQMYKKMYDMFFYPAISQFVENEEEKIYRLEFFTNGVVSIINKWIELDCVTEIDKLIEIIKNCVRYEDK